MQKMRKFVATRSAVSLLTCVSLLLLAPARTQEVAGGNGIVDLSSQTWFQVVNGKQALLVDFYVQWCPECRALAEALGAGAPARAPVPPPALAAVGAGAGAARLCARAAAAVLRVVRVGGSTCRRAPVQTCPHTTPCPSGPGSACSPHTRCES